MSESNLLEKITSFNRYFYVSPNNYSLLMVPHDEKIFVLETLVVVCYNYINQKED